MDATFAALLGATIGGMLSVLASWIAQRVQSRSQWVVQEIKQRKQLYSEFIQRSVRCYADALQTIQILEDLPRSMAKSGKCASIRRTRWCSRRAKSHTGS